MPLGRQLDNTGQAGKETFHHMSFWISNYRNTLPVKKYIYPLHLADTCFLFTLLGLHVIVKSIYRLMFSLFLHREVWDLFFPQATDISMIPGQFIYIFFSIQFPELSLSFPQMALQLHPQLLDSLSSKFPKDSFSLTLIFSGFWYLRTFFSLPPPSKINSIHKRKSLIFLAGGMGLICVFACLCDFKKFR